MVTTIQINNNTLRLLKNLKEEINANSYDEAITKIVNQRNKKLSKSMAGSLAGFLGPKPSEEILRDLKDERRKSDRF